MATVKSSNLNNSSSYATKAAVNASLNQKLQNSVTSNNTIWTTSASNGSISNATSGGSYVTLGDCCISNSAYHYDDKGEAFTKLMMMTSEKELDELFERMITNQDTDECKFIIRTAVKTRHFSEDFLIKYFDYLTLSDILVKHEENIKSHEYASLVLILTQKD